MLALLGVLSPEEKQDFYYKIAVGCFYVIVFINFINHCWVKETMYEEV